MVLITILLIVLILLANSFNFCWRHGRRKIRKSFVLLYWGKILYSKFVFRASACCKKHQRRQLSWEKQWK